MKKILLLLMVAFMSPSIYAETENGWTYIVGNDYGVEGAILQHYKKQGNENLQTLIIPNKVGGHPVIKLESISKEHQILDYEDGNVIETLDLSQAKSLTTIGKGAFFLDKKLSKVIFNDKIRRLGDVAFYGTSLSEDFELVNSIEEIGIMTLPASIRTLVVGEGCRRIGSRNLIYINTIRFKGATPPNIERYHAQLNDKALYVPEAAIETYRNAYKNPWLLILLPESQWDLSKEWITRPYYDGTLEIVAYHGKDFENLSFPSTIDGKNVVSIGSRVITYASEHSNSYIGLDLSKMAHLEHIQQSAFSNVSSMDELNLPHSLKEVRRGAFAGVIFHGNVTLGNNIISCGSGSFNITREVVMPNKNGNYQDTFITDCLGKIHFTTAEPIVFNGLTISDNTLCIVPNGSKAAYQAHEYYQDHIVVEESEYAKMDPNWLIEDITIDEKEGASIVKYLGIDKKLEVPTKVGDKKLLQVGKQAFKGSFVRDLDLSKASYIEKLARHSFFDQGLQSIKLPKNLKCIDEFAFKQATLGDPLIIPEGTEIIMQNAFIDCFIRGIVFPSTITEIEGNPFPTEYNGLERSTPKWIEINRFVTQRAKENLAAYIPKGMRVFAPQDRCKEIASDPVWQKVGKIYLSNPLLLGIESIENIILEPGETQTITIPVHGPNSLPYSKVNIDIPNAEISNIQIEDVANSQVNITFDILSQNPQNTTGAMVITYRNIEASFTLHTSNKKGATPVILNEKSGLKIYPTHASDHIMVENYQSHESQIMIYDMLGQLKQTKKIHGNINRIDISALPAGIYIIRSHTHGQTESHRIVKL
ncbi:leucine-rich repeat protein [Prolixibacteraceae bacterium]|nr:leucine-rich repeat protein [Prolixibacteraceae bacterium]